MAAFSFDDAIAYLGAHVDLESGHWGGVGLPTLDRVKALLFALGDPQKAYPVVHVTGTNGKGSVTKLVTELLSASGLSVGTYTSPHLERVTERISWNGEPLDEPAFAAALDTVARAEWHTGVTPTAFEVITAAAYAYFADIAVDVAVVEVGMLGRWDATNAADAAVAVVTNVGYDHTEFAGPSLADIASEKAGIVKPGSWLVLGETSPDLVPVFRSADARGVWQRDAEFGCDANTTALGGRLVSLYTPHGRHDDVFLSLHGGFQGDNAAAAVSAVEAFFGRSLDAALVAEAFGRVRLPGRLEVVGRRPLVVLDGAHNPDGAREATRAMARDFKVTGDRIMVVGLNNRRRPDEMLEALGARSARVLVACEASWGRARAVEDVVAGAAELGVATVAAPSVAAALEVALDEAGPDDAVLVTGSMRVVGEARTAWRARTGRA